MVIVFAHLDDEPGWVRVSISTFALMSSFIMLMIERVTMQLAHMIWKRLVDIEKERNFATMRVLWDYKESTVNSQKLWIKIFYFIVMVFWISVIVYFSIYSITTSGLTPGNGPT